MKEKTNLNKDISDLTKRVNVIEEFLVKTNDAFKPASKLSPQIAMEEIMSTKSSSSTETVEQIVYSEPSLMDKFIEWCKTDWLMKLGAFLLLLALGWFITYAFVNNWIGPMGRITLGILFGTVIMIMGNFVVVKRRSAGQIFVVLGGVMVLLTIFAARMTYDYFTPLTALAMMSVVVIGMATVAVVHNTKSVAILALLGGVIVPLLVKFPQPDFLVLLSYIFVLNLGTVLVVVLRGWREMIALSLIVTGLYNLVAFSGLEKSDGTYMVWIFMALYFSLFFISNIVAIIKTRIVKYSDLFTSAVNGLLLLYWIYEFVPNESASLVLSALVLLLVGISYVLVRIDGLKSILYINSALAILFLGAATAFELKGEALTIAFAIEALIIVALSMYTLKDSRLAQVSSVIQFIPIIMTLPNIFNGNWLNGSFFNKDFFVIFTVICSLVGTTAILKYSKTTNQKMYLVNFHGVVAGIFAIVLIWLSSYSVFDSVNLARGTALVIYSIVGVILFFYGTYLQNKTQRIIAAVLLSGVVIRLLLFEVWSMSLLGRIITFLVIGILLVSTAFFQKRIHHSN